nr:SIR2 family protein [uncultured Draconibacterium sp.]
MKRLLILGAGASYGHGYDLGIKPPLAKEFFTCEVSGELLDEYNPIVDLFVKNLKLDINSIDIESLYENVDAIWNLLPHDSSKEIEEYFKNQDFFFVTPIEFLRSYIIDVIYESTKWLESNSCPLHDSLLRRYLNHGDTIISFNYDLIIDSTLKNTGEWQEKDGYGFNNQNNSKYLLLKPHGSINWKLIETLSESSVKNMFQENSEKDLKEIIGIKSVENYFAEKHYRLATNFLEIGRMHYKHVGEKFKEFRTLHNNEFNYPYLIYPMLSKPYKEMTFGQLKNVWEKMYKSLLECDEVTSIGFSFRDEHFNKFIKAASLQRDKELKVSIVDTSKDLLSQLESKFDSNKVKFYHKNETLFDFCNELK